MQSQKKKSSQLPQDHGQGQVFLHALAPYQTRAYALAARLLGEAAALESPCGDTEVSPDHQLNIGKCLQGRECGSTIPLILSSESGGKKTLNDQTFQAQPGPSARWHATTSTDVPPKGTGQMRKCPQVLPRRSL